MSTTIANLALHQLVKGDNDEITLQMREDLVPGDASTENLVHELHRTYTTKGGKGFGHFKEESEVKSWLDDYQSNKINFYDFALKSSQRLLEEVSKYPFAEEGLVVFAEYQSLATDYLLICIIPMEQSLKVTEGLDIGSTDYLNISKMDIVARIDLTTMNTSLDNVRYLTYMKGRVGRKVSDFFLDFLDAEIGLDSKVQSQVLMQAVSDFCSEQNLDQEDTLAYKKQVSDYCNDTIKNGDEVSIKELSTELPASDSGSSFLEYTTEKEYGLEDSFPADRTTVRKLTKFVGAGGGLNISFDSVLLNERIFYNAESQSLTIKGLPANLVDQFQRHGIK
ncbi:nucleoid-associated protein YejK [Vibrio parahaemolyticus]|nr:nucleoid-associated protein YejK [Vibrio parahaemolyticus]EJO2025527.1 nucleoid-associated protein YejK [Vibrio parahaemolyticus]ELA8176469.1 nucleoid-associated protein YejK [Vibrio alginolyticus]